MHEKQPTEQLGFNFFCYSPDDGLSTHGTIAEAIEEAESYIEQYLDESWDESVEGIFVGTLTHEVVQTDITPTPEGECDYECKYKLVEIKRV